MSESRQPLVGLLLVALAAAAVAVGLLVWQHSSNENAADRWNALPAEEQHRIYRADPRQTRLFLETVDATLKP